MADGVGSAFTPTNPGQLQALAHHHLARALGCNAADAPLLRARCSGYSMRCAFRRKQGRRCGPNPAGVSTTLPAGALKFGTTWSIMCVSCPQTCGPSGYRVMMTSMARVPDNSETTRLIERAVRGDQRALGELLSRHRGRLHRMVALHLDRRLQGRVDPSDVIQEACLDAARRLPEYQRNPAMPFFLWLRLVVGQRLVDEHRKH